MAAGRPSPHSTAALLGRMLGYAKPYALLIAFTLVLTLLFAGGRYGRAYLMKPLLDEVLMPFQAAEPQEGFSWIALQGVFGPQAAGQADHQSKADAPTTLDPDSAAAGRDGNASAPDLARIQRSFFVIVAAALAIVIVTPFVLFARAYLLQYTLGRISVDIKQGLAAKLLRLPLSFHHGSRSGDTLSRTLNDATASEASLKVVFGDLLQAAAMVFVGGITLFIISWQLTLVALPAGLAMTGVVALFARRIRKTSMRRQEQLGEVTQRLVDILSGIKVIKAFRGEELENEAFRRETRTLFRRDMKVVKNRVLSRSLIEGLNGVTGVVMLALGCLLVLYGKWGISTGDVAAFATVLATTYRPVKTLSKCWAQLAESLASAERFFAILDKSTEIPDPPDAVKIDGVRASIRFAGVSFGYGGAPVLRDVSLDVRAGEFIALVGRSGEGKTTLVDCLLRFHDPDGGHIEIDGVDLRRIARDSLLDQIAIVSQESFLFDTSIRENIQYGRPDASHEEVLAAAHAARVDDFVDQLPEGLETEVGEFGLRLSGGQRQRITIARALLKHPAILIFDEATSALDVKTEQTVQEAIEALRGERTLFIVAHRLSTIRQADRIVVLDHGRIVQQGRHEELLEQPGLYQELVRLQGVGENGSGS